MGILDGTTMERILIGNLQEKKGETVLVQGWISVRRDQGKMVFFDIRDRSGTVQGVVLPNSGAIETAKEIRSEYVVSVEGKVNERPEKNRNAKVQNGDIELEITGLTILAKAEIPFELGGELNLDTYLDHLPFTLRAEKQKAIFKVQAEIIKAYRAFLGGQGFIEFQSPKLIGDDAEGSGEVFEVKYLYDKIAHLATSPQLYKQIMVGVFERVFTTGNVYRAEKHSTTRHVSEYTSMDAEFGFIKDHTDIMALETEMLRAVCGHLTALCKTEFELMRADIPTIPERIPAIKLREAQELIFKETKKDIRKEPDLEPEDERWMCEWSKREHNSDFIFITHYPVSKRPFYAYEDENDLGYTKSFDLLFRGIEITTGGQRRHNYENLVAGAKGKGLNPDNFSFYLQAFKSGMPPHGGWGIGLERLTAKMLGLSNVKEATLFPRDINRIDTLLSTDQKE